MKDICAFRPGQIFSSARKRIFVERWWDFYKGFAVVASTTTSTPQDNSSPNSGGTTYSTFVNIDATRQRVAQHLDKREPREGRGEDAAASSLFVRKTPANRSAVKLFAHFALKCAILLKLFALKCAILLKLFARKKRHHFGNDRKPNNNGPYERGKEAKDEKTPPI